MINDISFLPDPCPLPDQAKKRTLDDRERLLYAPFSGVGGLIYDKDAVYIELGGSHSHSSRNGGSSNNPLLNNLIATKNTVDSKLQSSKIKIFSNGQAIESNAVEDEDENGFSEGSKDQEDDENDSDLDGSSLSRV